ncbi:uncharacterized protein DSM5745_02411 [Aspergillus mulundensis]|uniref:Uncharacterized protein n=1 Tax=Aspergillus mulundensis TaxID=1810919 RepID=A0A3D8SWF7_9EURO|nr:hypothetical protein DSM5745_02411 [Aspergillus mulundensis]RDW90636.1 hypothetical protein DSM5745_02411 [Aspergillus mulundensis]
MSQSHPQGPLNLHITPLIYDTSRTKVYILTLGPLAISGTIYYYVFDRFGNVTGYLDKGDGKFTISPVLVKHSNPKIVTHEVGSVLENRKRDILRIAEESVRKANGGNKPWFEIFAEELERKGLVVVRREVREAVNKAEDCWLSLPSQLGEMWLESKEQVSGAE